MTLHEAIARHAQGNRDVPWDTLPEAAKQSWLNRVRPIAEEAERAVRELLEAEEA